VLDDFGLLRALHRFRIFQQRTGIKSFFNIANSEKNPRKFLKNIAFRII